MENPIKMDDLGEPPPYFWKHPYCHSKKNQNQLIHSDLLVLIVGDSPTKNHWKRSLNQPTILKRSPAELPGKSHVQLHGWFFCVISNELPLFAVSESLFRKGGHSLICEWNLMTGRMVGCLGVFGVQHGPVGHHCPGDLDRLWSATMVPSNLAQPGGSKKFIGMSSRNKWIPDVITGSLGERATMGSPVEIQQKNHGTNLLLLYIPNFCWFQNTAKLLQILT